MRYHLLAACALLVVGQAAAVAGDLPSDLISRYRPAVENIRKAYTHGTVKGTSSVERPQDRKSKDEEFVMRSAGQKRRLDVTTTAQQGMNLKVGAKQSHIATPDGSLTSYTYAGHQVFDDAGEQGYKGTTAQIDGGSLLNYTYSVGKTDTIFETLTKGNVKITSVQYVKVKDQNVIQIEFDETVQRKEHTSLCKYTLTLLPEHGWASAGFTRTSGTGNKQVTERVGLTYSGVADGVPVVQSIQRELLRGASQKCVERQRIEVTDIKFGAPDGYFFTSFAF